MEEDSSELNEEDMAMIPRKLKKILQKDQSWNKVETPQQIQEH